MIKNSAWCSVVPCNFDYSTCVFCCKNLEKMHFIWMSTYLALKHYLRTLFYVSFWRRDCHFTWSSEPREGLAVFKTKAVTLFLSYFSPAVACCCCCCVDVLFLFFFFVVSITMILNFREAYTVLKVFRIITLEMMPILNFKISFFLILP